MNNEGKNLNEVSYIYHLGNTKIEVTLILRNNRVINKSFNELTTSEYNSIMNEINI